MKLSEKRKDALYDAVHTEIMRARVKIAVLLSKSHYGQEVDDILSDLTKKGPEAALKVFEGNLAIGKLFGISEQLK